MKKAARSTLASIASACGVSRTTVSNAYNRPEQLSSDLRRKILAEAARRGYPGPDPTARSLRTRQVGAIGVLLTEDLTYAFDDRASVDFLAGLAESCGESSSSLVIIPSSPKPQDESDGAASFSDDALPSTETSDSPGDSVNSAGSKEAEETSEDTKTDADDGAADLATSQAFSRISQAAVDGFVVYSVAADDPALKAIMARDKPTVICDQPTDVPSLGFVGIDDAEGIQGGVRQLIDAGHRHIGILSIRLDRVPNYGFVSPERLAGAHYHVQKQRVEGILSVLRDAGIAMPTEPAGSTEDTSSVTTGDASSSAADVASSDVTRIEGIPVVECYWNDADGARQAVETLLTTCPELTAIACTTDSLALAALAYAKDHGMRVPQDLSVTGFDGVEPAKVERLTTVAQPNRQKGYESGQMLRAMIKGAEPSRKVLPTTVLRGETVAPPRY